MSDLFDTQGVNDDVEHWDALADRVAREAMRQPLTGLDSATVLRAGLIAATLLLGTSLAFMIKTSKPGPTAADFGRVLAPGDDVGRALALTGSPPAIASLLFGESRIGGQP